LALRPALLGAQHKGNTRAVVWGLSFVARLDGADVPGNQPQSTSAEAEILSPSPDPGEQKRETTLPVAVSNSLRTQPTGERPMIPPAEAEQDGGA